MVRRAHIKGYKSLADVDVRLDPLTVLFGPNAAGKSNFLDALHLLSRMASESLLTDAFAPPYRGAVLDAFTLGPRQIDGLFEQEVVSFSIEVDVELSPAVVAAVEQQPGVSLDGGSPDAASGDPKPRGRALQLRNRSLRYRAGVEFLPRQGTLRVAEEMACALDASGEPQSGEPLLKTEESRVVFVDDGGERVAAIRYRDHLILRSSFYRLDPHLIALREELASWRFFYLEPREKMRRMGTANPVRHIGLMGEDLAVYLYWLRETEPRQFMAIERALKMVVPGVRDLDLRRGPRGEVELWINEDGTSVPASVASEGTLRIVGLLALGGMKPAPALIGFEEPENGIHPSRIELVGELLKTRSWVGDTQLIITTHSPLLLDQLPPASLRVCEKIEGHTRIAPLPAELLERFEKSRGFPEDEEELSVGERWVRGALRA